MLRFVISIFGVALMLLVTGAGFGQNYPSRPIRILTGETGGSSDFVLRIITPSLSSSLGQPVIIDNRPSALIAGMEASATPDGYTLLGSGNLGWLEPLIHKTSYDPVKDFAPITMVTITPAIVFVHPSLPVNSVKELIALAKAKPGALNYASGPSGGPTHLAPELFKALAGVNIVRVPYNGGGPALNAVIAGEVQLVIGSATAGMPQVKSGRLKALAVTSAQPSALFPGLPTVASTVPGYEAVAIFGLLARAGTPTAVINRLNREIVRVINTPNIKDKFANAGSDVVGSSPQEFANKINSEMARMGKVIRDAGIKAE